ncbi:hypothetical protein M501DRAFT_996259 [Patellaria atrata CBS 101060]|uniref:Elongator complex protein 5 n=1 Tax=Patellaria atrata CBS 101060 TaxID=1346257 RepID=A0A9P4S6Z1_9PEZI|nr:hypothetical protein M501DRAFT_996259 [Patellaria atrata CBS 101060]
MNTGSLRHRRTHHLLLISKLLNNKENASPFTLIVDNLEQSGKPLVREYIKRAVVSKLRVIFVSFETLRKPLGVEVFIQGSRLNPEALQKNIQDHFSPNNTTRHFIIFDSLTNLSSHISINLPLYLSSFISPATSLLAIYHADTPSSLSQSPYSPSLLTLLKYLSTTIVTVHSISHLLAEKAARDRSVAEPVFGLSEENEGVIVGLGSNDSRGMVLEVEFRRKSGRGMQEWYFLPHSVKQSASSTTRPKESVILLEDHPLYARMSETKESSGQDGMDTTFDLGLTEKQRRDREGVVLPYFDAQKGEGGEGGRILYDMGVEDDFDEEEDEI